MKKLCDKNWFQMITSGMATFLIIWILFLIKGYAPFGDNSLATMDAEYQYIDLFGYLKDVLSGDNSALYSFSKSIGGSCIGIFGYYLSSPFNLLILFFKKSQIVEFFHLVISLKLAVAAAACTCFINNRFARKNENAKTPDNGDSRIFHHGMITVILSVSYALCQYSIAQSSNIMWLDGVYMLPFIMLGVYRVTHGKGIWRLAVPVGCSILFNWYTGGINCLFAIIWFVFEVVLLYTDDERKLDRNEIRPTWHLLVRFVAAMAVGVMLSCILFLPVVGALRNGPRGDLELRNLLDLSFNGNIFSVANSYSLGAKSAKDYVTLFCGSVALLGAMGSIIVKPERSRERWVRVAMAILTVLLFYWNPLYTAFSLFKSVGSYYSRYAYVGVFAIIFLAADFYLVRSGNELSRNLSRKMLIGTILFGVIMIGSNFLLTAKQSYKKIGVTIVIMLLITYAMWYVSGDKLNIFKTVTKKKHVARWMAPVIICVLSILETGLSVSMQMDNYHRDDVQYIKQYIPEAERIYSSLKEYSLKKICDESGDQTGQQSDSTRQGNIEQFYRVNNTVGRNVLGRGIRANYDESLAYGFWGLGGYTSSPDAVTLDFMDSLGYRKNADCMTVVNTSNIAVDSLMGVKYVTSARGINGLKVVKNIEQGACSKMKVYANPYALPMAFVYTTPENEKAYTIDVTTENGMQNPFEYVNELYSQLLGEDADVFVALNCKVSEVSDHEMRYDISIPAGKYAVYGNIPWYTEFQGEINVNDKYKSGYAKWISPTVFYIPTKMGALDCHVTLKAIDSNIALDVVEGAEQFYGVDLARLKKVTDKLRAGSVNGAQISNGSVKINVDARSGESLFLSIPYDSEWKVELNGEKVTPDLLADALYSVKLVEGNNEIRMSHHIRFGKAGIIGSIAGMLIVLISLVSELRHRERKQ